MIGEDTQQGKKHHMKLGGFLGKTTFHGDFDDFVPYLLLGEQWHIGKGVSFGLGKYKMKFLE